MGPLSFEILGPLEVRHGDRLVPVRGIREQAVLGALLLEAGLVVPLATLVEAVWESDPPQTAEKAVRNAVSALRGRFAQAGGPQALIEASVAGYRLRLDGSWLDASEFAGHVAAARELARSGRPREAVVEFRAALGLWRGPALAGLGGLVIEAAAAGLNEQRLSAWEECLELELQLGRHREVIDELRVLVIEHPLRERLTAQLMLALYRADRQAEALDAYHQLAKRIADDLGLDTCSEMTRMYEAILSQDPRLELPVSAGENSQAADGGGNPGRSASSTSGGMWHHRAASVVPAQLPLCVPGFAGRTAELGRLHSLLPTDSGPPGGRTVVISVIGGTAGVGKTALAIHFARQVADRFPDGQLYVNLRGFDPAASPVPPTEVLSDFLAALGAAPHAIPGSVEAQAALYRSLLDGKRMLVLLDNARDASHVRLLLPGSPGCLVIVTSRSQLTGLTAAEGARPLRLDVLADDEAHDLLAQRLGEDRLNREPDAAGELATSCARLPLALAIVAARAAEQPGLALGELAAELRDKLRRLDALEAGDPATDVRTVFSWSYRQLSAPGARLFRLLGLHPGPDITPAAAASLAAIPASEASRLLAELARIHLLTEHVRGRFTFHDLLRAYAAELARNYDSGTECRAAIHRLLDHYLHSACAASRPASPNRRMICLPQPQPGVRPEHFTGNQDALAWFDAEYRVLLAATSLAVGSGFEIHAWQLPWTLARFQQRRGYWHERVHSQRVALAAAERLDDPAAQARVHHELALAYNQIGHNEDIVHGKLACELFRQLGDTNGQAVAVGLIGRTFERQGRWREALGYAQQYLEVCQEAGNRSLAANALNAIGWCCAHLGDYRRARDCCEQALAFFRESGDLLSTGWTADTLGYAHFRAGDYAEAAASYRLSIRILEKVGDRAERARALVHLGEVHEAVGDRDAAREAWQEALDFFDQFRLSDAAAVRGKLAALWWAAPSGSAGPRLDLWVPKTASPP